MTFEEVLPYLKSGKTIEREGGRLTLKMGIEERWNGTKIKYLIVKDSNGFNKIFDTSFDYQYGFPSIFSNDWIVID